MAIITAQILEGRDTETKALLIEELTAAFDRVCGHGDTLYVVINEVSRDNWGVGGHQLAKRT